MRSITAPASLGEVSSSLTSEGWALLPTPLLYQWLPADGTQAEALHTSWNELPPDTHPRDGGHYRFRRHSCFVYDTATQTLTQTPHRAHWQPVTYNALHGGFERWFEPVRDDVTRHPMWQALLSKLRAFLARPRADHMPWKLGLRFSITALMASLAAGPRSSAPKSLSSSSMMALRPTWPIFMTALVARNAASGLAASLAAWACA